MIPKSLFAVIALEGVCFAMSMTILNIYVTSLGGSRFYLGALGSVNGLISLIWNPIGGSISDRIGRKPVLLSCLAICAIANFLVASTSNLAIIFVARALTSFGSQIMVMAKALIDDHAENEDERAKALSKFPAFMGIAFLSGSFLNGVISESSAGPGGVFYVVSVIALINLGLCATLQGKNKEVAKSKDTKNKDFKISAEIKAIGNNLVNLDWPKFWDLFAVKLIMDITVTMFHFNFGLMLTDTFGLKGRGFGFAMMYLSTVAIIISVCVQKLKSRLYGDDKSGMTRLFHGNAFLMINFISIALIGDSSLVLYLALLIPQFMGRMLVDSTCMEVLLGRVSANEKGSVMGAFESTMAFAGLVAPMISGVVSGMWGESMASLLSAALAGGAIGVVFFQRSKAHQS